GVYLEGAAGVGEGVEMLGPLPPRPGGHERQEHVVQLVRVAHLGGRLGSYASDRVRVKPAKLARLYREAPAQRHRARAALADLGVLVEVGEGRAIEDL